MSLPAEAAELRYGRQLDQRFDDQEAIDREIARLEAQEMKRYGKIGTLFVEMCEDCEDADKLIRVLYELAEHDIDLARESQTFRGMLEERIAEDLGI